MKSSYKVLVLYPSATCNLNCTYCYIDKSPVLKQIDEILDRSFATDYYFDFAKEIMDDHPENLEKLEFWGGEPSIGLHRMYNLLPKFIEYFPNLHEFMMSTNLTPKNWFDEFYGFLNILNQYPNKKFIFDLQLSIDGPEEYNDKSRGKGVTKKFLEHYYKLIETAKDNVPKNIEILAHFKPTYTAETISNLQTKEKILEYFTFFDNLVYDCRKIYHEKILHMATVVPNTAVPSPHTKQDGLNFANYCRLTEEINEENKTKHYFKEYHNISSFVARSRPSYNCGYNGQCYTCGTGNTIVGLLPEKHLSACHNGFVDLIGEYKKNAELHQDWEDRTILKQLFTNQDDCMGTCMTMEEYKKYEDIMNCFYRRDATFQRLNLVALIRTYAKLGEIDSKYIDEAEALKAADYFLRSTSFCVRDSLSVTGSLTQFPIGLIKLLLNGAQNYVDY